MKVLHINTSRRGIGNYGVVFGSHLNRSSEVKVLNIFNVSMSSSKLLSKEIDYNKTLFLDSSRLSLIKRIFFIRKVIKDFSPDIIHDSAGYETRKMVLIYKLLNLKPPLIFTVHDPVRHVGMESEFLDPLLKKLSKSLVDHYFVHGPYCKKLMVEENIINKTIISIIYHGPYNYYDTGRTILRKDKTVLFFGALRPNKGLELLVDVIEKTIKKDNSIKFIIAGRPSIKNITDDQWPKKLDSILEYLTKNKNVTLIDRFIEEDEAEILFKKSVLTILPYKEATQSGVAMIAMALGSIILATRTGDIPFVIEDNKNGYLVNYDSNEIANKIYEIVNNQNELTKIKKNALSHIKGKGSWEEQVKNCLKVYRGNAN